MSRIVEKLEIEKKSDTSIEQEKMEEDPDRFHLGGFSNLENIARAGNVVIQGSRDKFIDNHRTVRFVPPIIHNVPVMCQQQSCW